jgi:soluble calcium-activated nucleotidase 1
VLLYTYHEYDGNMSMLNDIATKFVYNSTYPITPPKFVDNGIQYTIGIVADLDKRSKSGKDNVWLSYFLRGSLVYNDNDRRVTVHWDQNPTVLKSAYSLAGRGMELSELTVFNGRLLTFDDRTGIVYEIKDNIVTPWVTLTDGDGNINKGLSFRDDFTILAS